MSIFYILNTVKCECSLHKKPERTICIGPSIPPCDCSQASCKVNSFCVCIANYVLCNLSMYAYHLYTYVHISVIHLLLAIMAFVDWIPTVMAVLMKI